MRIIKAAKRKEEVIITCTKCRSILGIQASDYHYDSEEDEHFVRCPVCREDITVPESEEMFTWIMEDEKDDNTISDNHSMREYEV